MFFPQPFTGSGSSSSGTQVFYFSSLSPSGWSTSFSPNSSSSSSRSNNNSNHGSLHHHHHYYSSRGQNLVPIMLDNNLSRSSSSSTSGGPIMVGGDPLSDLEAQILRHFFLQHSSFALDEHEPSTTTSFFTTTTATAATAAANGHRSSHRITPQATNRKLIARLPVFVCDSSDAYQKEFGDSQKDCSICLSESEDGEKWVVLPCQHSFHPGCIKPWLKEHNSCPTCRFELEMADYEQERQRLVRMSEKYGKQALELMGLYIQIQFMYSELQKWTLTVKEATAASSSSSSSNNNNKNDSSNSGKQKSRSRSSSSQHQRSHVTTVGAASSITSSDTNTNSGSVEEKIVNLSKTSRKIQDLPKRRSQLISLLNSRETKLNEMSKRLSSISIRNSSRSGNSSSSHRNNTSSSSPTTQTQQPNYAWDYNVLRQLKDQCSYRIMMIQGMIDHLREIQNYSRRGCCAIC